MAPASEKSSFYSFITQKHLSSPFFPIKETVLTIPFYKQDMFVIATSSCARFLPSRRGYSSLSAANASNGRGGVGAGRNNRAEDENRLIDQLDEEWDD